MKNSKSGQVALIILLIMVVILTIGLSLISHSVIDVSISKDEEEAIRAFSAAEAGIEEALKQADLGTWTPGASPVGGIEPSITVSEIDNNITRELAEGEMMNIHLAGGTATSVDISWDPDAALELTVFKDDDTVQRGAVASGGGTCYSGFDTHNDKSANIPDDFLGGDLTLTNGELLRIRVLCNNTTVTVAGAGLPTQQYDIDSRAAAGGEEESKVSAIEVSRTVPELPSIFDYVLFSGGNLQ